MTSGRAAETLKGGVLIACVTGVMTAGLATAAPAWAANIDVETTSDVSLSDGECSLREALTSANANSNAAEPGCAMGAGGTTQDFIRLPAGTYTLGGAGQEDLNASGDLDYTGGGPLVIQGTANAAGVPLVTIDAPPSDRIIDVPATGAPNHQLFLDHLALTDGRSLGAAAEGDGGAIRIADTNVDVDITSTRITGSQAARNGGAVSYDSSDGVFGNFKLEFSELSGNAAGTQVAGGSGGAIWSGVNQPSPNDPIVNASTLAGNSADGVGGGFALKSSASPTIRFRNSTLSGNTAKTGGSAVGFSGTTGTPSVFFEFSTVAGNTSPAPHAAIESASAGQSVFLRGSIIAGNTGAGAASNCAGSPAQFNSQGYNVESANTCALVPANPDLLNTDPLLAPLVTSTVAGATQTTRTHGLYDGSPAVDFIPRTAPDKCDAAFTDDEDQRGIPRPVAPNGLCDAGAFEGTVGPKPVAPVTPIAPPAVQPPTPPSTVKRCRKGTKRKVVKGKVKCIRKKKKR